MSNKTARPKGLNLRGLIDAIKTLRRYEVMCMLDFSKFQQGQINDFNKAIENIDTAYFNKLADSIYAMPDGPATEKKSWDSEAKATAKILADSEQYPEGPEAHLAEVMLEDAASEKLATEKKS